MRILQVAAFAAPFSGNFIYSLEVLEKIANMQGHQVYYAFPEPAREKDWCKRLETRTKVFYLPLSKARIKKETYSKLKKICLELNIDIIHSHFELYDLPALYAARKSDVKVIWHLHDAIDVDCSLKMILWNKVQYSFFGRRVRVFAIAEHYKKILQKYGMSADNVEVIYNGINTDKIDKTEKRSNEKDFDFLSIGGDFNRKGMDVILHACQLLAKQGYNFKILISGNQKIQEQIEGFFDADVPEWLTFQLPVKNINELFKKCRNFIQASRQETFSFAVCEAAYAGLDILISNIEGMKWAKELPTVNIFTNENVEELSDLMKSKIATKEINEVLLDKTRKIICQKYSSEKWAKEILRIYGE